MKQKNNAQITRIIGSILFFLIISVIFIAISDDKRVRRVLFFPRGTLRELTGEVRFLPQRKEREDAVGLVVKELILGPVEYQNIPLMPGDTKLRAILVRQETAYVDLTRDFVYNREDDSFGINKSLDGISETIRYNFPSVKEVKVTVNGEPLFEDFHIGLH